MCRAIIQLAGLAAFMFPLRPALAATIDTVPVGNPGNAADTRIMNDGSSGYGAVAYNYRIGTTEVTNAQYTAFLNAKAASDPLALYHALMGSNLRGGIKRTGSDGNYVYSVKTNMGNKPVNYVTWYDAIRFVNWLHNGQGGGDTETGAYTLIGGTPIPSNGLNITRNANAVWFLSGEDEWYKAAYYDPRSSAENGPPSDDNYWLYPSMSDDTPTLATATSQGDVGNPGENVVNYLTNADWNGQNGNVTTVGSAGPLSDSFYGTSDQGGNVWEYTEALSSGGTIRVVRGGAWNDAASRLSAGFRGEIGVGANVGFRVATVPEPPTAYLAAFGVAALVACALSRARYRRDFSAVFRRLSSRFA